MIYDGHLRCVINFSVIKVILSFPTLPECMITERNCTVVVGLHHVLSGPFSSVISE